MRIAIHHIPGSCSDGWIEICRHRELDFALVDCRDSDIIGTMMDFDILLWHWNHNDPQLCLFAYQLTLSLEAMGKSVFPDSRSCWHFDDKVGQKYLLEGIGAPLVPSYVFYDKEKALEWVRSAVFPKVFKLRGGAAGVNVQLVADRQHARALVERAFGRGFAAIDRRSLCMDRWRRWCHGKDVASFLGLCKGFVRLFVPTSIERQRGRERGYVYFQDFVAGNEGDTRVVVIGDQAFGFVRGNREGDFRASGSGRICYQQEAIDERCVRMAFEVSHKVGSGCLASDFIFSEGEPQLVEISYGFKQELYYDCPGLWNRDGEWLAKRVQPEELQLDMMMNLHRKKYATGNA